MPISTVAQSNTFDYWRLRLNDAIAQLNNIGEYNAISIIGGNIDGTVIGNSVPAAGTFTNLTVQTGATFDATGATLILDNNSISGDKINGGTAECDYVILANDPTLSTHAARKGYVDAQITETDSDAFTYALIFS